MKPLVLDSSVVIKWFVPEEFSDQARRCRTTDDSLNVPDFFIVEITNIVWKKAVIKNELARDEADDIVATCLKLPLHLHPAAGLIPSAYRIACETGRTVYDCLYLALAIQIDSLLVTADQRFVNALTATPYASHICWLGGMP